MFACWSLPAESFPVSCVEIELVGCCVERVERVLAVVPVVIGCVLSQKSLHSNQRQPANRWL